MSSQFKIIRTTALPLGAPDTLLESVQVNPAASAAGHVPLVSPDKPLGDGGKIMQQIELVGLCFDAAGAPVAGTFDFQFIEMAPWPTEEFPDRYIYTGRAPVVGAITGRGYFYDARYLHKFGLIISNIAAVGATKIVILWRGYL